MIEIILFGRGGQGAVKASQILATAAFHEGKYAQAFPSFGPERRGALVWANVRIDDRIIVSRNPIVKADYVIVLDASVLKMTDPFGKLKAGGCAILNVDRLQESNQPPIKADQINFFCIDATKISEQIYGKTALPITNMAMLGALASVSKVVQLHSVMSTAEELFTREEAEKAIQTAQMAFDQAKQIN